MLRLGAGRSILTLGEVGEPCADFPAPYESERVPLEFVVRPPLKSWTRSLQGETWQATGETDPFPTLQLTPPGLVLFRPSARSGSAGERLH
jgi:hypothetical protein